MPKLTSIMINALNAVILTGVTASYVSASAQTKQVAQEPQAQNAAPIIAVPARPELQERLQTQPLAEVRQRGLTVPDAAPSRTPGGSLQDRPPVIQRSSSVEGTSWLDLNIPVCWESMDPDFSRERGWVEDAIERSWDQVSNIDFTDWQGCTEDSPGVRIDAREAGAKVAHLGRQLGGLENGMTLNFTFASWATGCATSEGIREFCIRALAVHEFGHVLGLAHEDLRNDDDRKRRICYAEPQGPAATFYITSYDPQSVMNYCSTDWVNNGRLTALDVAGVRMIYGPFDDETPATVDIQLYVDFRQSDGTVTNQESITDTFVLTEASPARTGDTQTVCHGNQLLDINLGASLEPEGNKVDVTGTYKRYTAGDACRSKGELVEEGTLSQPLFEARTLNQFVSETLVSDSADAGTISLIFGARRTLGTEADVETCTNCAAASAEAVFATRPGSSETSGVASPWPSDFNIDLEACKTAAKAGPDFGGSDWTEANLTRLCGATPASKEPAICFGKIMVGGLEYGGGTVWNPSNALTLCGGSSDANATIACFSEKISAGSTWQTASLACATP